VVFYAIAKIAISAKIIERQLATVRLTAQALCTFGSSGNSGRVHAAP
jgi:hypothetical protein